MKVIIYKDDRGIKDVKDISGVDDQNAFKVLNSYMVIADSALTNTGKPFYLPEDLGKVSVSLGLAVRIIRLGKHISEKFAYRYYSVFAPVLHFKLPDYEKLLMESGLPTDASRNFDKSVFMGEFEPLELSESVELFVDQKKKLTFSLQQLPYTVGQAISDISILNTLKMGDIIVLGLSEELNVKEGDFLEVRKGGEKLYHVKVK